MPSLFTLDCIRGVSDTLYHSRHYTVEISTTCTCAAVVATLVHRSLSGISPLYLADDCRLVADAHERDYVPQRAEHAL